jgi:hypothetical protein
VKQWELALVKNFARKRCEAEISSLQSPEATSTMPRSQQEHEAPWPKGIAQLKVMPALVVRLAQPICAVFRAM